MRFLSLATLPVAISLVACGPAAAQQQRDGSRLLQQLEKADGNHDGSVSRAEFQAYRATQFARLDRNKDGFFEPDDIPRFAANRLPDGLSPDNMVRQFDANGDGKVSQQEFVSGPTLAFDRLDANSDGVVTPAEFDAARAALADR